jgi:glucan biosynthesis protein C
VVGILAAASGLLIVSATGALDLQAPPRTALDSLLWILIAVDSWSWTLVFVSVGMRALDFTNTYLDYGQAAILPFFVFHQPVIIVLAYFVVQWPASLAAKLLIVVVGAFCVTLGLYEFVIRRIGPLSRLFGMKAAPALRGA